jgi:hypothetical protein
MKKFLSLIFTLAFGFSYGQGTVGIIDGTVSDSLGNAIPSYPVMVIDSSANGSITITTLLTDLNGYFNDTLLLGAAGSITLSVQDSCTGAFQNTTLPYSANTIGGGLVVITSNTVICNGSSSGGGSGGGSGSGNTIGCNASYQFDTVLTGMGQVVLYNTSTVDSLYSQYGTVSYLWDFGDGNVDTAKYPTHVYTQAGVYSLCVTVTGSVSSAIGMSSCSDTYCDTVIIDSSGTVSYKNVNVVLNVYSPQQMNIREGTLQQVVLYPNPSKEQATLEVEKSSIVVIRSIEGKKIREWKTEAGSSPLPILAPGAYIIQIQDDLATQSLRWVIAR